MRNKELYIGIKDAFPIVLGYIPLGFAFGILANQVGMTVFQACLMSLMCFTGAGQYIAIGVMQAGGALFTIIAANILVNLRYFLFATSMVPYLKNVNPTLATLLSYGLTDETYAVAITRYQNHSASASYMAGLNITSHFGWIISTLAGAILGNLITNTDRIGLGFALPAMYICLLIFVIRKHSDILVALVSAGFCILIGCIIPSSMVNLSNIIIATLIAASLGVIVDERH
ncbi:MAG: AzlC family ABC transporter permease [Syntrophomonadaceae bacterium]|jgi:4-azaleucine resistance transporter AzlC